MMGEIVNLRLARKRRVREAADTTASQNRIAFGLSKAEKKIELARRELSDRKLDGHKIDASDDGA